MVFLCFQIRPRPGSRPDWTQAFAMGHFIFAYQRILMTYRRIVKRPFKAPGTLGEAIILVGIQAAPVLAASSDPRRTSNVRLRLLLLIAALMTS